MRMAKLLLAMIVAAVIYPVNPAAAADPAAEQGPTIIGVEKAVDFTLSTPDAKAAGASSQTAHVIHEPGATYIKVHFSKFSLAPKDFVTVANPAGTEVHTYHGERAYSDSDFTVHGRPGFSGLSIDGDTAVITVHGSGSMVQIDGYWRGLPPDEIGIQSVCSTDARRDVVCYQSSHPTEFARSRAVAKLLIGGGGSCTTWRVGNTNRMLTNKHCFSTQSQVSASEMQFNFQCATCGGNNPGAGTKVSGATLLRVSSGGSNLLDYTLYSVNNFTAIQGFGTLFLETRSAVNGERIYIPGHGDGRPKRLSIYDNTQGGANCTVRSAAYTSTQMSYSCDTSGGNSGSPVLSANHRVIALHHLGGCPNNQGARIHLIYNEIRTMIDNNG